MPAAAHLTPLDLHYPSRLRLQADRPASITVRGDPVEAARTVAIVGSREATAQARAFARSLSSALAREGVVVVSGGALGIDAAAHEGALAAGGRTWAVAGTGRCHVFPAKHAALFETIAGGPGAMIWPFPDDYHHRSAFLSRNRVLVALADVVVVVQAGLASGALHAASCARKLGRPLWVVPAAPWMTEFSGSGQLLDEGAYPLTSTDKLLRSLGLSTQPANALTLESAPAPSQPSSMAALGLPEPISADRETRLLASLSPSESAVLKALSSAPLHVDAIATRAGHGAQATSAALLTLALEDVVVEGPPGFFCRRDSCNH